MGGFISRFGVYESMGWVEAEERPVRLSDGRVESVLKMRELVEQLNQHLYSMHDVLDKENCGDEER